MNYKILATVVAALCLATPFLVMGTGDASAEATEYSEMRKALTAAGYEVDGYTDEELIEEFGWFANKNLIGKYTYDDPTGLNWLLDKAGLEITIEDVATDVAGEIVNVMVDGIKIVVKGVSIPLSVILDLGFLALDVYEAIMESNAYQKAEVAWQLMQEGKNYAVYETTVFWNTMANGYDVEEW